MTTTTTIILKTRRLRGSMSVYSSSGGSPECMGQLDPVTHARRWFVQRVLSKDLRSHAGGRIASKADAPGPLPSAAPKVVYIHVSDGAAQEVALVDGGRDGQASATIEAKRTG
jgi:hypothetical protein